LETEGKIKLDRDKRGTSVILVEGVTAEAGSPVGSPDKLTDILNLLLEMNRKLDLVLSNFPKKDRLDFHKVFEEVKNPMGMSTLRDIRVKLKRIYDPPTPDDGIRVLEDELWPRGLRKDEAKVDLWLREVAPSKELREWFSHDPSRWEEFRRRYRAELEKNEGISALRELIKREKTVTLLFSARDRERNNAVVLKEFLEISKREHV
jgi:uncharacterized protein YeaO (DUF488 family)